MSASLGLMPRLTPSDAKIVRTVFSHPGIVRRELAEHLQTSEVGLTAAIRRLINAGVLVQVGSAPSMGGRRASQLAVNPGFASAQAHVIADGRLCSGVVNASGELAARVETPLKGPSEAEECVVAAATSLGESVASSIAAPGLPDEAGRATAPYLFGREGLNLPGLNALSTANALVRFMFAVDPPGWEESVLCVDLADGATAVLVTPGAPVLSVDPTAVGIDTRLILQLALADEANRLASSITSDFRTFLRSHYAPIDALVAAEAADEPAACALFDRLVDEAARVLATLAQLLRPSRLVFSMKPEIAAFVRPQEIRKRLRKKCPVGLSSNMAVEHLEADTWSRVMGAGLAALDSWLESLETSQPAQNTLPV